MFSIFCEIDVASHPPATPHEPLQSLPHGPHLCPGCMYVACIHFCVIRNVLVTNHSRGARARASGPQLLYRLYSRPQAARQAAFNLPRGPWPYKGLAGTADEAGYTIGCAAAACIQPARGQHACTHRGCASCARRTRARRRGCRAPTSGARSVGRGATACVEERHSYWWDRAWLLDTTVR